MNDSSTVDAAISAPDSAEAVRNFVVDAFRGAERRDEPYAHWVLSEVFPEPTSRAIVRLPFPAPVIDDTEGKRDTHNSTRIFFSQDNQRIHGVCAAVSEALQHPEAVSIMAEVTGADLAGSSLRIEYAQDREGFWLEPHTDIGPKRITFILYLIDLDGGGGLGTDIYADDEAHTHVGSSPAAFNQGFVFIPARNTWHGFERRPIPGIRRSLIINYVGPEWRNRQELCFPDAPV